MNILVTGANGQLGSCIKDIVKSQNLKDNYFFTDINELDICDSDAVEKYVENHGIEAVINCAAYTNVDKAEEPSEKEKVFKLNAEAPSYLGLAMKKRGGTVIHISTDYVFGGNFNNTPCTEDQPANPTGVYGKSKLEGERNLEETGVKSIILRTSWLYSAYGKNFMKTMLDLTSRLPEIKVVFDQCGTPTFAGDLADAIIDLVENRKIDGNEGIYHFSNEGVCSWYDFATVIARIAGQSECRILPCHSDEFPSKVKRPAYSVLDKSKYKKTFGKEIPYWVDSLKTIITKPHQQ